LNNATPWWGTLVVAGVGFFGVLLAQLWTSSRDQRRADQERHERAVKGRADVYADFYRSASSLHLAWNTELSFKDAGLQEIIDRLWRERALIALLAPAAVARIAQAVLDRFVKYAKLLEDHDHASEPAQTASTELLKGLNGMLRLMRMDLDMGLRPRWWQFALRRRWHAARKELKSDG
jgi:hypothetical protein